MSELIVSSAGTYDNIPEEKPTPALMWFPSNRDDPYWPLYDTNVSDSGMVVNEWTALSHGPVWHATNLIAGDIAALTIEVRRRVSETETEVYQNTPAWHLLRDWFS